MVAKIISGKSMRGILHYNENKVERNEATLLMASGFAGEIAQMNIYQKLYRFENLTERNQRVKTNALHLSLNFAIDDQLDNSRLANIAAAYMDRIGFGDQPFLVYRHLDAGHMHLHIATTNIRRDGSRIDIHGIGYKLSQQVCRELEQEYGLHVAKGWRSEQVQTIQPAVYGDKPTRQQLNNITGAVMREYRFTSFAEYNAVLKTLNVQADRGNEGSLQYEKRGLLYSILKDGMPTGVPLKASALAPKPTFARLEERFAKNKELRECHKEPLKKLIDRIMTRPVTQDGFKTKLQRQQVDVILRRSETGLIYGLTFVDHRTKTVFNGSDLGKAYSAKALTEKFIEPKPQQRREQQKQPKTKQQESYLPAPKQTNFLDIALGKVQQDYGSGIPKKRKRRKRRSQIEQDNQLTL